MKINLTSSRRTMLFIGLVAGAVVVGMVLAYLQYANLRNLREEVEDEKVALEQAIALRDKRLEHRRNAPQYEAELARLRLYIPDEPEEEEILRYFAFLAEEYTVDFNDIRFGGRIANTAQGFTAMPLSIVIEGRYRDIADLLEHLRVGERAFRIDNLIITVASAETVRLRLTLSANAFFRIN